MRLPLQILNGMEINWTTYKEIPQGLHRSFALIFADNKAENLIENIHTEIRMIRVSNTLFFPVSVN